jgi:hypothetical protein
MKNASSSSNRQRFLDAYEDHLAHQRRQRAKYYKHRQKAIDQPDKYMSIILDAMDQKKCTLPHVKRETKSSADLLRMKQKLMGCLVHGYGMYLYLLSPPVAGGGNFSVYALARTLEAVGDQRESLGRERLPPTLYLQLDNASDNKCKAILAFADYLVATGVFRKVKLCFLLVGHTHEDVDQYFRQVVCLVMYIYQPMKSRKRITQFFA